MSKYSKSHLLLVGKHLDGISILKDALSDLEVELHVTKEHRDEMLQACLDQTYAMILIYAYGGQFENDFEALHQTIVLLREVCGQPDTPVLIIANLSLQQKLSSIGGDIGLIDFLSCPLEEHLLKHKVILYKEIELFKSQAKYAIRRVEDANIQRQALLNIVSVGLLGIDTDGKVTFANPKACLVLKKSKQELVSHGLLELIYDYDLEETLSWQQSEINCVLNKGGFYRCPSKQILLHTGESIAVEFSCSATFNQEGECIGSIVMLQDLSNRQVAEQYLLELSHRDPLTQLANRAQFFDSLKVNMLRTNRSEGIMALLIVGLDGFKNINEHMGHDVGDQLLVQVAEKLKLISSMGDLVARIGGDEFAIILDHLKSPDGAKYMADKIIDEFSEAREIAGKKIYVHVSIGISVYTANMAQHDVNEQMETMVKAADTAMVAAKKAGKNNYRFFSKKIHQQALDRTRLENGLIKAITFDEFSLLYQPKVSVREQRIVGVEALLRWYPQAGEPIPPAEFIPVAESCGMIQDIGAWVIEHSCAQMERWISNVKAMKYMRVGINISTLQLKNKNFYKIVDDLIKKYNIDPNQIELELTETAIMEDPRETILLLHELHDLGVYISMDDFGTGYSSLSYLKKLPLDALKIDKLFIDDIGSDKSTESIIKAMIAMAHQLDLNVVAEGVEQQEQLQFLMDSDCDFIQGYYFSRPVCAETIQAMILEENGVIHSRFLAAASHLGLKGDSLQLTEGASNWYLQH